jgi:hypothetical protein
MPTVMVMFQKTPAVMSRLLPCFQLLAGTAGHDPQHHAERGLDAPAINERIDVRGLKAAIRDVLAVAEEARAPPA